MGDSISLRTPLTARPRMGARTRRFSIFLFGDQDEMKKLLLTTVALVALGAPALAADMAARPYTKAPPPIAVPIYNWTGFYIGAHLGAGFGNDNTFNGLVTSNNDARFLGGVQA